MQDLEFMSAGQAQKEVTFNNTVKSLSPSFLYSIKSSKTAGLTLVLFGGWLLGKSDAEVPEQTIILPANKTNYVQANGLTGIVTVSNTGFTEEIPLYIIKTSAITQTETVDRRPTPLRASTYSLPDASETQKGGVLIDNKTIKKNVGGQIFVNIDGVTLKQDATGMLSAVVSGGGGGSGLTYFIESKINTAPHATIPLYSIELGPSVSETNADILLKGKGNGSVAFFNVSSTTKMGRFSIDANGARANEAQTITGNYSFGGGQNITISSINSFSWGLTNIVSGNYSVVFGNANNVSGTSSGAFGDTNTVSVQNAFAFGRRVNISGGNSFGFGDRLIISGTNQLMIGEGGNSNGMDGGLVFGGRWDTGTANGANGSCQARQILYRNYLRASNSSIVLNEASSNEGASVTAGNQLSITANKCKFFRGTVMMVQENIENIAIFDIEGVIKRVGVASTTEIIYTTITPKSGNTTPDFSVELTANKTLGCLTITCSTTTPLTKRIFCNAFLSISEITATR